MRSPCCLYMSVNSPPISFSIPEPVFMKLGLYVMAPELMSAAYFVNPSHQSVSVCDLLPLLGHGSVKTFPWQRRIVEGVVFYSVRVFRRKVGDQFSEPLVMYFP
jgi:hypothetical protein